MIAGLRATNEALLREQEAAAENAIQLNDASTETKISPTPTVSNLKNKQELAEPSTIVHSQATSPSLIQTSSIDSKDPATPSSTSASAVNDGPVSRIRKKSGGGTVASLNRSDSTGSASGRKFLAPSLSDPSARIDKDRCGLTVVSAAAGSSVPKSKPRRQIGASGGITPTTSSSKMAGNHGADLMNHHTGSSHHLLSHHLLHHHHHGTNDRLAAAANAPGGGSSGTCSTNHSSVNAASAAGGVGGVSGGGYSQHHLATMDFHMAAMLGAAGGFGGRDQFQMPTLNKTLSISNQVSLVYEVHDWWSEQVVVGVTISDEDE